MEKKDPVENDWTTSGHLQQFRKIITFVLQSSPYTLYMFGRYGFSDPFEYMWDQDPIDSPPFGEFCYCVYAEVEFKGDWMLLNVFFLICSFADRAAGQFTCGPRFMQCGSAFKML